MPNHVLNEMIFSGLSSEQRDEIVAGICNAEGLVDFSILVPPPPNCWQGNLSSDDGKQFPINWYSWNRENWGTKWNAYGQQQVEHDADKMIVSFQTAWSPPFSWFAAVLNKFKIPFDFNYLDEGADRARSGKFLMAGKAGGPECLIEIAPEEIDLRLHKLMYGVEEFADD